MRQHAAFRIACAYLVRNRKPHRADRDPGEAAELPREPGLPKRRERKVRICIVAKCDVSEYGIQNSDQVARRPVGRLGA